MSAQSTPIYGLPKKSIDQADAWGKVHVACSGRQNHSTVTSRAPCPFARLPSDCPGGPVIDMKYGRKDATSGEFCAEEGYLPAGNPPFPDAATPQDHLRKVFYRQGFDDQGIVALSGAHTLGRARKVRVDGAWHLGVELKECCCCCWLTLCCDGDSWSDDGWQVQQSVCPRVCSDS